MKKKMTILFMALLSLSVTSKAQWAVIDPTNLAQSIVNSANEIVQTSTTAQNRDKDYFIVTTVTDGEILNQPFQRDRIVAPCGNVTWKQCENACTKDIWEDGEIEDGRCPHCGAALVPNTVSCKNYIEEGYLSGWSAYTEWLSRTLNKTLTVLELGEGFLTPTVIRWPFEKTVFFNRQAWLCRVHHEFPQISEELKERAEGIQADSVEWIGSLARPKGKELL